MATDWFDAPNKADLALEDLEQMRGQFSTLRSSFSSATEPSLPVVGQLWWDTTHQELKLWTGSIWRLVAAGAQEFTDLLDCFSSYVGHAGKYLKVNLAEDGIVPVADTGGADTFLELGDTPSTYPIGSAGKGVVVNVAEDGLEFSPVGVPDVVDLGIISTGIIDEIWNDKSVSAGVGRANSWIEYCAADGFFYYSVPTGSPTFLQANIFRYDRVTDSNTLLFGGGYTSYQGDAAFIGDNLYMINNQYFTRYNVTTGVHSLLPASPIAGANVYNPMMVAIAGKLFLWGGTVGGSSVSYLYDPGTGSWIARAPMPININPVSQCSGCVAGNLVYSFGGRDLGFNFAYYYYDYQADTWHAISSPPIDMLYSCCARINDDYIWVAGELGHPEWNAYFYRVSTDTYTIDSKLPPIGLYHIWWNQSDADYDPVTGYLLLKNGLSAPLNHLCDRHIESGAAVSLDVADGLVMARTTDQEEFIQVRTPGGDYFADNIPYAPESGSYRVIANQDVHAWRIDRT